MKRFLAFSLTAAIVVIDQLIKMRVRSSLELYERISVIPNLFYITHVENPGAAWGIFSDKTELLTVISGVLLLAIAVALISGEFKRDFLIWTVAVGLAGGIGNFIDRVARGIVVDYLDFSALFNFPVFNFADCCIVIATGLILIYIIKTDAKAVKSGSGESRGNT